MLAFLPALRRSDAWRATATPLASIMGSGFLVSAPLVVASVGVGAPIAMLGLVVLAYGIGAMIRFNIVAAEPELESAGERREHSSERGHRTRTAAQWRRAERTLASKAERLSHIVLAGAYVVTVSYYLALLSSFVLDRFGVSSTVAARSMTTAMIVVIGVVGVGYGLAALERIERYAVAANLGMVAALIAGLVLFHISALTRGTWSIPAVTTRDSPFQASRHLAGLLIVVQGFETSRFLGTSHGPRERARSMRVAQIASGAIYVAFSALVSILFHAGDPPTPSVTEIVRLVGPVASVLPILIVVCAAASQFSAAVADDAGCSGLLASMFGERLSSRIPYALIAAGAIALTWSGGVLAILSYASRAFGAFYTLQCVVAFLVALEHPEAPRRKQVLVLAPLLALLCAWVTIAGLPAEGGG